MEMAVAANAPVDCIDAGFSDTIVGPLRN